MVLEETTKYDNGKHYTRKERRKEGRQAGREAGRKRGRGALQQFGGVQMALRTQLWTPGCNATECWERTRESKQTELLANEAEDEAEGKGEEQDKEKQVKLGFCLYFSWETLPFLCRAHIPAPLSHLGFALLRTASDNEMKK